jgi:hypothetical protein
VAAAESGCVVDGRVEYLCGLTCVRLAMGWNERNEWVELRWGSWRGGGVLGGAAVRVCGVEVMRMPSGRRRGR